jgi:hypothetical protein
MYKLYCTSYLVLFDRGSEGLVQCVDELQRIDDALEYAVQAITLLSQPLVVQVLAWLFDGDGDGQKLDNGTHLVARGRG